MKWRSERRYRRLPGRPFTAFSRASMWLAEDHVLSVQSNRFSEDYKRYYLRDIQAFTVQRTGALSLWTYGMGALAAAFLAPGLFFNLQNTFLWVSGGLFLAIALALMARGPTCACYIQTAVSRERLRSLRWVRTAEKTLHILQPHIERVQGPLTAEMTALTSEPSETPVQAIAPPPLPTRKQPETGWGYELLFFVLLLDAVHSYWGMSHKGAAMTVAAWAILIAEIAGILWLLVRQRRFEIPGAIRALVIVALIVTAGLTYTATVLATVAKQQKTGLLVEVYDFPLHVTAAAADGILASAGLLMMVRYRQGLRRPPPFAAPE